MSKCLKNGRRAWTDDEIDYLFDNYEDMTAKEMAENLNRSVYAIYRKCRQLWIEPKSGAKEYAMYRGDDYIAMGTAQEIADETGLKINTTYNYTSKRKHGRIRVVEL